MSLLSEREREGGNDSCCRARHSRILLFVANIAISLRQMGGLRSSPQEGRSPFYHCRRVETQRLYRNGLRFSLTDRCWRAVQAWHQQATRRVSFSEGIAWTWRDELWFRSMHALSDGTRPCWACMLRAGLQQRTRRIGRASPHVWIAFCRVSERLPNGRRQSDGPRQRRRRLS